MRESISAATEADSWSMKALQLFALCGFAISQPLFDLLGRNPEFFVARQSPPAEVTFTALGLLILPPLVLFVPIRIVGVWLPGVARLMLIAVVGGLLAASVVSPLYRAPAIPEGAALIITGLLAGAGAALYWRSKTFRQLLAFLCLGPIAFGALFLTQEGIRSLVLGSTVGSRSAPRFVSVDANDTPVVLLVLDELPLSSLLADVGEIDAVRYPSFAALASRSTWYTNATTISPWTMVALPSILTGRYPKAHSPVPIRANYPESLFAVFDAPRALNVIETQTLLHLGSLDRDRALRERASGLIADLGLLYAHMLLPSGQRERLPSVDGIWGGFLEDGPDAHLTGGAGDIPEADANLRRSQARRRVDASLAYGDFESFIESIGPARRAADPTRPSLHFAHLVVPHQPWSHLPSGRRYRPQVRPPLRSLRFIAEPEGSIDSYRAHLLELGKVDRLLGRLIQAIRAAGIWDAALVIVMADHGAGFWPGSTMRFPKGNPHPEDLLHVPLFVKYPGQSEPAVDSRRTDILDILPTIARATGIQIEWPLDGCELQTDPCAEQQKLRLVQSHGVWPRRNATLVYDHSIIDRRDTLDRKLELFGSGEWRREHFSAVEDRSLLGRRIETFLVSPESAGTLVLDPWVRTIFESNSSEHVPARIVGSLERNEAHRSHDRIVLVVDDVVEVVASLRALRGDTSAVMGMLPEPVLDSVPEGLRVYCIEDGEGTDVPGLAPISIE